MTHTAQPMTLDRAEDICLQWIAAVAGNGSMCAMAESRIKEVFAELAKQREAEPVVIPIPTIIDRTHVNRAYVTYGFTDEAECDVFIKATRSHSTPLYTHPQQRNAVEVTDAELRRHLAEAEGEEGEKVVGLMTIKTAIKAMRAALSAVASRDREDVESMDAEELAQFVSTVIDFDDCEETSTDYEVLMRWERMGLLECERFLITQQGRKLFDDDARRENKP